MPGSSPEGKRQALEMVQFLGEVTTILDVGPGAGTYYDLLHPYFPLARFDAVEIFAPYVERYRLMEKYDSIIVADAAEVQVLYGKTVWSYDLAIFGDVIEHMKKARAIAMVQRRSWRHALISTPIIPYPQGPSDGNPYEAHVASWTTEEVLSTFHVEQWWRGELIGVFLLRP